MRSDMAQKRYTHNQLGLGILLQHPREDISNKVDTFLQTPPANKHKELSIGVLFKAGPFLSQALLFRPTGLEGLVNGWLFTNKSIGVP